MSRFILNRFEVYDHQMKPSLMFMATRPKDFGSYWVMV